MRKRSLISRLVAVALEGATAGLVSGLAIVLIFVPVQELLAAQPDPAFAFAVLVAVCGQIGVAIAISVAFVADWSS